MAMHVEPILFLPCFLFLCFVDGMNEDGSFIGQYGRKRLKQENVAINPYGTNV